MKIDKDWREIMRKMEGKVWLERLSWENEL
jgi:hypothetical protein